MRNFFQYIFLTLFVSLLLAGGVLNNLMLEDQFKDVVTQSSEESDSTFGFSLSEEECHMPFELVSIVRLKKIEKGVSFFYTHISSEFLPTQAFKPPENKV